MDTQEIDRVLRSDPHTSQYYDGTFAVDTFPSSIPSGRLYVINLDDSHQEGSHWVQVGSLDAVTTYFDSFGRPPPPNILKTLAANEETVLFSDIPVQSPLSQACGYHVLLVSLLQARGYSLMEILTDCYRAQEKNYLRNDAYAAVLISSLTTLPEPSLINLKEFTAK